MTSESRLDRAARSESIVFTVNGRPCAVDVHPDTPLLYVLRNDLKLKGTRFGCASGLCGACTVHVDGRAVTSCDLPMWSVAGHTVTTIEGLAGEGGLHPLQQAFVDEGAGQCGYCLSGILMSAAALLADTPSPSLDEITAALERNVCRCGVHARVIRAIRAAGGKHP
jgi:aerobic-type carbon monoxide dehydrogenase small subunit (CoxS/CutS family)